MKIMTDEELAASAKRAVNCLSDKTKAEIAAGLFNKTLESHTRRMCCEYFLNKAAEQTGKSVIQVASMLLCNPKLEAEFMGYVDKSLEDCKTDLFKAAAVTKPENQ